MVTIGFVSAPCFIVRRVGREVSSTMFFIWTGFILLIVMLLALDLGVFNKKAHEIGVKEALRWTAFWIFLALVFNVAVYFMYKNHFFGIGTLPGQEHFGKQAAIEYFTGYIIEKSLSLDNIFVIAMIFNYFAVPLKYQHRALFWGILGALILRGIMIVAGVALIAKLAWMIYVFGGLLILTAVKLLFEKEKEIAPERNPLVRAARRIIPISPHFEKEKFFVRKDGRLYATPLFLVLIVVESSDVLFAIDSIPAIFAVTLDPFIVFTSNVFAILGLRSLYFALAAVINMFKYLKYSLVVVLAFVGVKMLISHFVHISAGISLGAIAVILATGVVVSVLKKDVKQPAGSACDVVDRDRPES